MAVNETLIRQQIRQLIEHTSKNENTEQAVDEFCNQLASIITNAVRSATITAPPGSIITVGGPTTQSNVQPIIFQIT